MERKIYGVSLGAGKETITLHGIRILKEADVIFLSSSNSYNNPTEVSNILSSIDCDKKLVTISMPVTSDKIAHAEHTALFAEKCIDSLNSGKKTAYVTMGDITVYSSFADLYKIFQMKNIILVAVSGISSFMAPAALIGCGIVEWNEKFCVIPMTCGLEDLKECVQKFDSTIIMKIYDNGLQLREFIKHGKPRTAVMVVDAYKDNERIIDLTDTFPEDADFGMAVVLIKK